MSPLRQILLVVVTVALVGLASVPPARAHLVIDGVNANASTGFGSWCAGCESIGWYYTPSFSYSLTAVHTNFDQFNGTNREVTLEVLTDRRAVGGQLLRTATFNSSVARGTTGGVSITPLALTGGTTYFIGFRNVELLGVNYTPQQNPQNLGASMYLDNDGVNDGAYELRGGPANSGDLLDQPILRFFTTVDDGDVVVDSTDNCPAAANANQADTDADGVGNACDPCVGPGIADVDMNQTCDPPAIVEPNGKLTNATQLFCPGATVATSIATSTDVDLYTLFLQSGTILKIDLDAEINGSALDTDLVVFDAAGQRLALSRGHPAPGETGPTEDSYLQFAAPANGIYFVGVAAFPDLAMSEDVAFTTGAYTMTFTCTPQVNEPNNTIATATMGTCPFTTQGNEIAPDDVDYFKFEAEVGEIIRLDVDAAQNGSQLDSILALFNSNGVQIGNTSLDDAAPGEPTPTSDSYIEFFVTTAGTYYVAVGSSGDFDFEGNGLSSGPYTLEVTCSQPPGEPNDTPAEATAFSCNSATVDTSIPLIGDVDFYEVDLTAGEVVTLDLNHVGSRFDPVLDSIVGVFDDSGGVIALNDDGGPASEGDTRESFLQFQVPQTGTYFIGVTAWDDFDFDGDSDAGDEDNLTTGRYELVLDCDAVTPGTIVPIAWSLFDSSITVLDEGSRSIRLPFTFPWFGRDIVAIDVNSNGLVELLEEGESCQECPTDISFGSLTHFEGDHVDKNVDAIFAANDDLITGIVVEPLPGRVEITWMGPTFNDFDPNFDTSKQLAFRVILFEDGRVQWKYFDMVYSTRDGDLFSGYYDEVDDEEREVPGGSLNIKGEGVRKAFQFTPGAGHPAIAALPWDPKDASIAAADNDDVAYTLPFTFPWFGRDITALNVSTNGLVELLENGESCDECELPLTHFQGEHVSQNIDALFAANDNLISGVVISGFADRVEIIWIGAAAAAPDFTVAPLLFKLILFPNGTVEWKFFDMQYDDISGDLFSGLYDEVGNAAREVYPGSLGFVGEGVERAFRFTAQFEGPPGSPSCSDGMDNDGDQLTDGADPDCSGCGDGNPDTGEACDDGDTENGDGCDANCTVSACGNGIKGGAEACDPQAQPNGCGFAEVCLAVGDAAECSCVPASTVPLDHFLGYKVKGSADFPKGLHAFLADQLAGTLFLVKKPLGFFNPADKNDEGIHDSATHLRAYQIAPAKARCADNAPQNDRGVCKKEPDCGGTAKVTTFCVKQPKLDKQIGIEVTNQFHPNGELVVDATKPERLLVPTAKSLAGPVAAPNPANHAVDHFTCYKIKISKGAAKFPKGIQAAVVDQFNQEKTYDVKKPARLCLAANKNSEGFKNQDATLMCYQVKPAKGQPKHASVSPVFVNNQLGADQLETKKDEELCVPSTKVLP